MESRNSIDDKTDRTPFLVADWQVDPATLRISNNSRTVKLEPKVMSLLVFLASRPGQVISRQELEDTIWTGTIVGYDALSNAIIKLRKAFNDKARNPLVIETISKTGYRLIAKVSRIGEIQPVRETIAPQLHDHLPEPSIAILPFDNMSGDPQQEYFSDGISEDITTDLSKFSGLRVIARNSAFAYKGESVKLKNIGQELGVCYLLEGSVRRVGQRVRINAQLIDVSSDSHIWAERYDMKLADIFSAQDGATRAIVSALLPRLGLKDQVVEEALSTPDSITYDYFLKARELCLLNTEEDVTLAIDLLEKVIEMDPKFSLAYSYLGRCYSLAYVNNWGNPKYWSFDKAIELGQKAIELNPNNAHAHFVIASSAFWLGKNQQARLAADAALNIDSNYAEGYGVLAMIQTFSGEPDKALDTLKITMRLDPHYRDIYLHYLALAHFHLGHFPEAVEFATRRLVRKPDADISYALLATTYGHLGDIDRAKREWDNVMRVNPNYSLEQKERMLPYQNPDDIDYFMKGFREAGIIG